MKTLALLVAVIAHRGEHLHHPENTFPAYQRAVEIGCDFIEVDVRTTADGKLMVLHDPTLEGTTTGKGRIKDTTSAQLRELDAGVKFGPAFKGTRIPFFDEVLAFAKGKIGIYVDAKDVSARDLVAAFDRHGMRENVVIYGNFDLLAEIVRIAPDVKVMPEGVSMEMLRKNIERLKPRVVALEEGDFNDDIIALAKQTKAKIYVDRLHRQDNAAHWEDAVKRGADAIQTDHPAELVEFLKKRGLH